MTYKKNRNVKSYLRNAVIWLLSNLRLLISEEFECYMYDGLRKVYKCKVLLEKHGHMVAL